MTREKNKLLFAYGSLLDPDLQMQLFGRHILSEGPAVLEQWEIVKGRPIGKYGFQNWGETDYDLIIRGFFS